MSDTPTWFLPPPRGSVRPEALAHVHLARALGHHARVSTAGYTCMVWVPSEVGGSWRSWKPPELSTEHTDLVQQVADRVESGDEESVDEWARRLGQELADAGED